MTNSPEESFSLQGKWGSSYLRKMAGKKGGKGDDRRCIETRPQWAFLKYEQASFVASDVYKKDSTELAKGGVKEKPDYGHSREKFKGGERRGRTAPIGISGLEAPGRDLVLIRAK